MKVLIIKDKDSKTDAFKDLEQKFDKLFLDRGLKTKTIELTKDSLKSCMGCFGCWIKTPGECVIDDLMTDINRCYINSDVVVYTTPIMFGQFSSNIKNAVDRSLPNALPFFEKADGVTKHPSRYIKNPLQIIIGYSDDATEEEKSTFIDINIKHRKSIKDIFICSGMDDNDEIIERISSIV